jgi:isoquinoline 1-oxidoreductase beta subunit
VSDAPAAHAAAAAGRRQFLVGVTVIGTAVGAALVFGVPLAERRGAQRAVPQPPAAPPAFAPNAFVRIAADDTITIIVGKAEMGQGIYTSLPMIVAEELAVDPRRMRVEFAAVDRAYYSPLFPMQFTGGSSSVRTSFDELRAAGALARTMLVEAAARRWQIPVERLRAESGCVTDGARRLRYGELVADAAQSARPKELALKSSENFTLLGKNLQRLDGPLKVSGRAQFGIDVRQPQMLYAMVARPAAFGTSVQSFDAAAARAVPGVVEVKQIPSGVAVLATNTWAAKRGREALRARFGEAPADAVSSDLLRLEYRRLAATPGEVAREVGDAERALGAAKHVLSAEYEVPYLAHACMEPLNCTVHARADRCDIWVGSQFQSEDRRRAAAILGLRPEQVSLHTTFLGGGFGRRGNPQSDFVVEAVQLAKALDRPVQVLWTREDDMRGGWYRPFFLSRLQGGLDAHGMPLAWRHTIVGQSVLAGTVFESAMKKTFDPTSVEGAADMPYAIPHLKVEIHEPVNAVPVQFWRSVGHSHTGFAVNGFLDELAAAGRKDPVALRRLLLADRPRHLGVLNLAAEKAGWGASAPGGRARGIALQESFGSVVAQVAEVSVSGDAIQVHRVVCAVDCGAVINPDHVAAQIEGGIVYGLSAALHGSITLSRGRVEQSNFNDYPVLRMNEMPQVETYLVASDAPMGGVGEIAVPCIAPAVCNAIYAATGKRLRRLPVTASLASYASRASS